MKDKIKKHVDELLMKLRSVYGSDEKNVTFEKVTGKVYFPDQKLEMIDRLKIYCNYREKLNTEFLDSIRKFLRERGFVTAGQYNALLKSYEYYNLENLEEAIESHVTKINKTKRDKEKELLSKELLGVRRRQVGDMDWLKKEWGQKDEAFADVE